MSRSSPESSTKAGAEAGVSKLTREQHRDGGGVWRLGAHQRAAPGRPGAVWDDRRSAERESGELGEVAERDREQSKHETEKAARQPATSTSATRRDFAVRTAAARLAVPATVARLTSSVVATVSIVIRIW